MDGEKWLRTATYDYELPTELIAQHPCEPRDHSRLLIVDRRRGEFREIPFYELAHYLNVGDRLIVNDTRVIPARLRGRRSCGGKVEIFLLKSVATCLWEALLRPGKKSPPGSVVHLQDGVQCEILEDRGGGVKLVRFFGVGQFDQFLQRHGEIPLPHYIQAPSKREDWDSYQTVYAAHSGAAAAPTAGLHFTQALLEHIAQRGVEIARLTLHVGLGTFRPVQVEEILQHKMHAEEVWISSATAAQLAGPQEGSLEIAVGTTSCRALETGSDEQGRLMPGRYSTNLFIYPGYRFKRVRALLTNFHLPRSSLLMLVCALGGGDLILEAYRKAVKDRFRFYSYGDAMLIL